MTSSSALLISAALCALLPFLGMGIYGIDRQRRYQERVRSLRGGSARRHVPIGRGAGAAMRDAVSAFGHSIVARGLLSTKTVGELRETLDTAGLRSPNAIGLFVGGKILLALTCPLLAVLLVSHWHGLPRLPARLLPMAGFALGLLAPDSLLRARRKQWIRKIEAGLPDALDVMVICTQAGVGIGPAIVQVGIEMDHSNAPLAVEFNRAASEMTVIADQRTVLLNLGARSGVEGMRRLSSTLIQALQYGTPISEALRTLSGELRHEALARYEAGAARLGVLLTLPTLLFIMPCVFIIAGGPAGIQVAHSFHH